MKKYGNKIALLKNIQCSAPVQGSRKRLTVVGAKGLITSICEATP